MKISKFKFIVGTLIIALVISVLPIGLVANADKGKIKEPKKDNKKVVVEQKVELISKEKAIEIAKERAVKEITNNDDFRETEKKDEIEEVNKIKAEDVKVVLRNNIYYIEFSTGIYKYMFNVNAITGKISYYNEVLLIENDSNLRKALRAAYNEIIEEENDIDYEDIKIIKIKSFLDAKEPYYVFELKTEKYQYDVKVIKEDFLVESIKQTPLKEEKEPEKDKDKGKDKDIDLRPNEINQILNAIKKEIIEEFKNAKKHASKEDKKQAITNFKANKELLKFVKKTGITDYLKDLKIEVNKKPTTPINEIKNLTRNQVEVKARERINARGLKLDTIVLKSDNNPLFYLVKMDNDNYYYELKVHATTGAILEYLRVAK